MDFSEGHEVYPRIAEELQDLDIGVLGKYHILFSNSQPFILLESSFEINSLEINSHEINSREINSPEKFSRDQLMHPMWDNNHKLSSTSTVRGKRGDESRTCLLDSILEQYL